MYHATVPSALETCLSVYFVVSLHGAQSPLLESGVPSTLVMCGTTE